MMMDKKPIDWDKLFGPLESKKGREKRVDNLTDEEIDMLRYSEEMHNSLQGIDPEAMFPVQKGWREFSRKRIWRLSYRMMAYAAVLFMVIGAGFWMYGGFNAQPDLPLEARTEKSIILILADGKELSLTDQVQHLQDAGSRIEMSSDGVQYEEVEATNYNKTVAMNRLEVPFGKRTKLTLSDGSKIWLNSGTVLRYPSYFEGDGRDVYLDGEAYFEIAHDESKRFIVHAGDLKVQVLGTSFGINTLNNTIETALVQGSVELEVGNNKQRLIPGEVGSYNTSTLILSKAMKDLRSLIAWKDNILYFDNMFLIDIVDRLSREYDYQFVFDDPSLANLRFTIDINQVDDLSTVLHYLQLSVNSIDFKIVGRKVHILRK